MVLVTTVPADVGMPCDRPGIAVTATKAIRTNSFPHAFIGQDGTIDVVRNDGSTLPATGNRSIRLAYLAPNSAAWAFVTVSDNPTHAIFPSVAADGTGAHVHDLKFGTMATAASGTALLPSSSAPSPSPAG